MRLNRREALGGLVALGVTTRAGAQEVASKEVTSKADGDFAAGSKVFALGDVARTKSANGVERVGVFKGTLATGEAVSAHESWTPAGVPMPALHRITHSEMVVVMEGEVEFVHDGKTERAKAGDVIYVAYGTTHAMKNVGAGTARYLVVQVGK